MDYSYLGHDNGNVIGGDDGQIMWHIREQRYMQNTRQLQRDQLRELRRQSQLMRGGTGYVPAPVSYVGRRAQKFANYLAHASLVYITVVIALVLINVLIGS